jgi:hypothetical protein
MGRARIDVGMMSYSGFLGRGDATSFRQFGEGGMVKEIYSRIF